MFLIENAALTYSAIVAAPDPAAHSNFWKSRINLSILKVSEQKEEKNQFLLSPAPNIQRS